jgi:hypothetical protein
MHDPSRGGDQAVLKHELLQQTHRKQLVSMELKQLCHPLTGNCNNNKQRKGRHVSDVMMSTARNSPLNWVATHFQQMLSRV